MSFPADGRLAAIDYGTVRIGVAVCDPDRILASPFEVVPMTAEAILADHFRNLARVERLVGWIVGLPIHCDGRESDKSKLAREFAVWLEDQTGLPTRLFDERFTTVAANQKLARGKSTRKQKKARVDAIAAQILLESFIEACRYRGEIAGEPAGASGGDQTPLD